MYQFEQDLQRVQQRINDFLERSLTNKTAHNSNLIDAMRYSLLLGGKRIRPFLVYSTGRMLGAKIEYLDYAALAIEAIHSYSLIHDDLPAMDDDTLRRGKPACHIEYGEATAILAGDALQAFAFENLSQISSLSDRQKLRLIQVLARAAGAQGMCLGQSLDLFAEHHQVDLEQLELIHRHKTGALIGAAVEMGFICSPQFKNQKIHTALLNFSQAIGLAFQVQDDILDITSNSDTLGKNAGSDLILNKSTYPKLLGLNGAEKKAQELIRQALENLESLHYDCAPLIELARFIVQRKN